MSISLVLPDWRNRHYPSSPRFQRGVVLHLVYEFAKANSAIPLARMTHSTLVRHLTKPEKDFFHLMATRKHCKENRITTIGGLSRISQRRIVIPVKSFRACSLSLMTQCPWLRTSEWAK